MQKLERAFEYWARREAQCIRGKVEAMTPAQWEDFYLRNPRLRPASHDLPNKPTPPTHRRGGGDIAEDRGDDVAGT
jgi:hypothetical protein